MLQYSIYSVISPEGCASILWKSADKAEDAAEAMRITATSLNEFGLVDEVLPNRWVARIATRKVWRKSFAMRCLSSLGLSVSLPIRLLESANSDWRASVSSKMREL